MEGRKSLCEKRVSFEAGEGTGKGGGECVPECLRPDDAGKVDECQVRRAWRGDVDDDPLAREAARARGVAQLDCARGYFVLELLDVIHRDRRVIDGRADGRAPLRLRAVGVGGRLSERARVG